MSARRAGALLALFLLAGCSASKTKESAADPALGVLHGVVVDPAVHPLAGVDVRLSGQSAANTTTGADGAFDFPNLRPGAYALAVNKTGYIGAQQTVEVVAGVLDPPVVKVVLEANPSARPYVEAFQFEGYIECGTSSIALCAVPNFVTLALCQNGGPCLGNVTDDRFNANYLPGGVPDWSQSELVWTATVQASDQFYFSVSHFAKDDLTTLETVYNSTVGGSPLLLTVPGNATHETGLGVTDAWRESVFAGAASGTTPPGCAPPCVGPGFAIQQRFTIYTHFFYHYQPPPGWRFTQAAVPDPPAVA